jgi:Na+/proline symporter
VLLFGILVIELKIKAPNTHTILDRIRVRWATGAHKVYMAFCFLTNIIVSAMLILGGAATVTPSLTPPLCDAMSEVRGR